MRWATIGTMSSRAPSRAAFSLPGNANTTQVPTVPADARDNIARAPYLIPRQSSKLFSEAVELFFEERLQRLDGLVARGDSGASGKYDGVGFVFCDDVTHEGDDASGLVGHDDVTHERERGELFGKRAPRVIVRQSASVADGDRDDAWRHA